MKKTSLSNRENRLKIAHLKIIFFNISCTRERPVTAEAESDGSRSSRESKNSHFSYINFTVHFTIPLISSKIIFNCLLNC